jgi:hypothetical protein
MYVISNQKSQIHVIQVYLPVMQEIFLHEKVWRYSLLASEC